MFYPEYEEGEAMGFFSLKEGVNYKHNDDILKELIQPFLKYKVEKTTLRIVFLHGVYLPMSQLGRLKVMEFLVYPNDQIACDLLYVNSGNYASFNTIPGDVKINDEVINDFKEQLQFDRVFLATAERSQLEQTDSLKEQLIKMLEDKPNLDFTESGLDMMKVLDTDRNDYPFYDTYEFQSYLIDNYEQLCIKFFEKVEPNEKIKKEYDWFFEGEAMGFFNMGGDK